MSYRAAALGTRYTFDDLGTLLAKATPARSGDELAGIAASTATERAAACMALADVPLTDFLAEPIIPYEADEVTRLIFDTHDSVAFAPDPPPHGWRFSQLAARPARDRRHSGCARAGRHTRNGCCRIQADAGAGPDCGGLAHSCGHAVPDYGRAGGPPLRAVAAEPSTDDPQGILAAVIDGLSLGSGDAVVGINPAADNVAGVETLLRMLDRLRVEFQIPFQSCVLAHVTTQLEALGRGAPVDLVFQSIAGTQAANASFGVNLALLGEAWQAARELRRGTVGDDVMYFETGQGSALSAGAHHGVDQQTCEARAYAVARRFRPMLVNTVVGFIGPEYLYDGKQIVRAGLEDHFCGKLLGLPMGCDVCYTNHAEADQDDMDVLLTLLGNAGVNYVMGVPGADDVMLNYQSTSFHDALYLRALLGLRPAPEFEEWLATSQLQLPRMMALLK